MLATLGFSILGFVLQWIVGVRGLRLTLWITGTVIVSYLIVALGSYLWNVARTPAIRHNELSREAEGLRERLKPQLEITFDETKPEFVDTTKVVDRGETFPCKLYRVAITSRSISPITRLKAKQVVSLTTGRTYPPLHLRITGRHDPPEKEIRVHWGEPQFWDVVEKRDSEPKWVNLMHVEKGEPGILIKVSESFLITASCEDGLGVTKRVILGLKENGDLDFKLIDP